MVRTVIIVFNLLRIVVVMIQCYKNSSEADLVTIFRGTEMLFPKRRYLLIRITIYTYVREQNKHYAA